MNESFDVLIVGGGHAGAQTAMNLRAQKFAGSIAIFGEEPELPYDRPPLSKEYLAGSKPWEKLLFHTADGWARREVTMRPGSRVVSLDPAARTVTTDDGASIGYGALVWATGGKPRRLSCSGHDAAGVHTVRNRADVDRMIGELPSVTRAVVIGGGYIGLEAASVLSKAGKQVVVLEAMERVLARVAGAPLSRFYEAEHRAHGVDIRLGVTVDCIVETLGRACGVRLADGSVLAAEMVIVGIGIEPEIAPLLAAGAEGCNGVRVDGQCRTSLPRIFAAGDCAEHRNVFGDGAWMRLESVQNAADQAMVVAKAIMGGADTYHAVPWFWSNQYDLKLQTVGLSRGYDEVVVRGDPVTRAFSVVYLRDGAVIALDCVNSVRDYTHGRLLITTASRPDRVALADKDVPLKTLVQVPAEESKQFFFEKENQKTFAS